MIIARTPYRISLFGGGTDYSSWYTRHGGCVLSTTINHFCHISARWLPPFHEERSRIIWSKIESVMNNADIEHPAVNAVLKYLGIENGIEIHHSGDLPARSGLGSSSTFTVGLLNALSVLQGKSFNQAGLALEAVHMERDVMRENVGIQDQIAAAYGGLNRTEIFRDGSYMVHPVAIPFEKKEELQNHLLLFFTGVSRTSSNIAKELIQAQDRGEKEAELHRMREMVDIAIGILKHDIEIMEFGQLMHESWKIKRSLARGISPQFVDDIYTKARDAGAVGGKLLGAGGGGFMLFFVRPEDHESVKKALKDLLWVPFKFENEGSKIIFNHANYYSRESLERRDYVHAG